VTQKISFLPFPEIQMKLQHIAAAALALTAFGSANAAIATGGNGSMVLIAYDKTGGTTTAGVFDLGLTLDQFVGSTGNGAALAAGSLASTANTNIVWDFNANTIKLNGATTTAYGNNNWTSAWNTLLANVDMADLQFVVTAFDTVGIGSNLRSLVTGVGTPTPAQLNNNTTQASNLQVIAANKAGDIFTPIANKGTIGSADNGAYTFTAADGAAGRANGYAMAGDAFGNEWGNNNLLKGETFAGTATYLWLVDGTAKESRALYEVNLNAATGQLIYGAVPEPTTYALLVTGLAVVGAAARRRRAA